MIWWAVSAACLAGLAALCLLGLRRHYLVIRVVGRSMVPALRPGDRVLVRRTDIAGMRPGMIVVLRDWPGSAVGRRDPSESPGTETWLVKRLVALPGDLVPEEVRAACGNVQVVPPGMTVVLSENPSGGDSRHWGFASSRHIVGFVSSGRLLARC